MHNHIESFYDMTADQSPCYPVTRKQATIRTIKQSDKNIMKTSVRNQTTLLFLGLMTAAATASAAAVFTQDFDGAYPPAGSSWTFAGGGYTSGSPSSYGWLATSAGGNPNLCFTAYETSTTSADGYAGQLQFMHLTTPLLPDPNMAHYAIQFDMMANYAATITLGIKGWQSPTEGGTADINVTVPTAQTTLTAANQWQTFVINLGQFTGLPTSPDQSLQFNFKIFQSGFGGSSRMGIQNQEWIDNFSLTVIPEPGTFALLGLGVAALLVFRRK